MSWTAVQPILQNTGMAWDVKLVFLHSCLTLCAMSTGTDMNDAESGDSSAAWLNDVLGSLAVSIKSSSSTLLLSGVLQCQLLLQLTLLASRRLRIHAGCWFQNDVPAQQWTKLAPFVVQIKHSCQQTFPMAASSAQPATVQSFAFPT